LEAGHSTDLASWHADIKPDNILYIRGKFKLADPGFAKWTKKTEQICDLPSTVVDGGTDTYGMTVL
jgi:hypothetical protein